MGGKQNCILHKVRRSKRNSETTTPSALSPSFPPSRKPLMTSLFQGATRAGMGGPRDQEHHNPTGQVQDAEPQVPARCAARNLRFPQTSPPRDSDAPHCLRMSAYPKLAFPSPEFSISCPASLQSFSFCETKVEERFLCPRRDCRDALCCSVVPGGGLLAMYCVPQRAALWDFKVLPGGQ